MVGSVLVRFCLCCVLVLLYVLIADCTRQLVLVLLCLLLGLVGRLGGGETILRKTLLPRWLGVCVLPDCVQFLPYWSSRLLSALVRWSLMACSFCAPFITYTK